MLEEFKELHKQYQDLLSKDECVQDTEQWYEPKKINIEEFKTKANEWICVVSEHNEIGPKDSKFRGLKTQSQVHLQLVWWCRPRSQHF